MKKLYFKYLGILNDSIQNRWIGAGSTAAAATIIGGVAFELYCRTPFGRIHSRNPEIIELANLIGRTSGSVALKMSNLARFDPELQKRNITAMPHGSKMDGIVFEEFSKGWQGLFSQAQIIRAQLQNKDVAEIVDIADIENIPPGKYRERMMKTREGQYFFRKSVLNSYGNRCCITGIKSQAYN